MLSDVAGARDGWIALLPGILLAACAEPVFVVLTVEDPNALGGGAQTLSVATGSEQRAELAVGAAQRFPLSLALSSSAPSKPVVVEAKRGSTVLARGQAEVPFDPDTPTWSIALQLPCEGDADCQDGKFCSGEERCERGSCLAGTPPCLDASDLCLRLECAEEARACVLTPQEAIDDGNACTLDLCRDGRIQHPVEDSLDPHECAIEWALVATAASGFVCGDGRHFVLSASQGLSIYDRYDGSMTLVPDPSPESGGRIPASASKDCALIAYTRSLGGDEVAFIAERDSGTERPIAHGGGVRVSADGSVAVLTGTTGRALWVDLGTREQVTLGGGGDPADISTLALDVSADGMLAAYWRVSRSSGQRALAFYDRRTDSSWDAPGVVESTSAALSLARLSGDGRFLIFSSAERFDSEDQNGLSDVFRFELSSRRVSRLTSGSLGGEEPSVSHDGRYVSHRSGGDSVVRIDLSSGEAAWICGPRGSSNIDAACGRANLSDDGRTAAYSDPSGLHLHHFP